MDHSFFERIFARALPRHDAKQSVRMQLFLMAAATYVMTIGLTSLSAYLGFIEWHAVSFKSLLAAWFA